MTDKEYLKFIAELVNIASESIGFLYGIQFNDNGYQVQEASKQVSKILQERLCLLLDSLYEKPNQ